MLILVDQLVNFFDVHPKGVLHVGAHEAEEAPEYQRHGWGHVIWVEMLPDKYIALQRRFANDDRATVLNAACWDQDGVKLPLFRAANGQSSSLLRPEEHLTAHPTITFNQDGDIVTSRLDTILPTTIEFDFINFDIQGAELRALRGLGARLNDVRWAYLEVNWRRLYTDCALIGDIDDFMKDAGFERMATRIARPFGWGDALYVRTDRMTLRERLAQRARSALWRGTVAVRAALSQLATSGVTGAKP
jgi:FkbM family methyltransferase